jgi:4-alpha-glucanotransferase
MDHFRGFEAYWAVPFHDTTARNGRWKPGPGKDFFRVLNETLGPRSIIAEDLGYLTESVKELLAYTGYPGMKILQFGFDSREPDSSYLPHCCPTNCILYAGTHDNDTVAAWLNTITEEDRAYAMAYMRLTEAEGWCKGVARTIWSNTADLTILQMQDILGLGSEARINTPSTLGCNWKWRLLPGQCSDALARELHAEMALYGRLP